PALATSTQSSRGGASRSCCGTSARYQRATGPTPTGRSAPGGRSATGVPDGGEVVAHRPCPCLPRVLVPDGGYAPGRGAQGARVVPQLSQPSGDRARVVLHRPSRPGVLDGLGGQRRRAGDDRLAVPEVLVELHGGGEVAVLRRLDDERAHVGPLEQLLEPVAPPVDDLDAAGHQR